MTGLNREAGKKPIPSSPEQKQTTEQVKEMVESPTAPRREISRESRNFQIDIELTPRKQAIKFTKE